jgi:hypothetical protein
VLEQQLMTMIHNTRVWPIKSLQILAFVSFVLSFPVLAQERFGVAAGPNISSLHHKKEPDTGDPRVGLNVSGFYNHAFTDQFGLQVEVGYTLAGAKTNGLNWNLHYLMAPVTAYYAPISWLRIHAGVQGGILLAQDCSDSTYQKGDFRIFDAGIQTGLEFMLNENVSILVRNYFGLMYNDDRYYQFIDDDNPLLIEGRRSETNRNNIFQINVRFYFPE